MGSHLRLYLLHTWFLKFVQTSNVLKYMNFRFHYVFKSPININRSIIQSFQYLSTIWEWFHLYSLIILRYYIIRIVLFRMRQIDYIMLNKSVINDIIHMKNEFPWHRDLFLDWKIDKMSNSFINTWSLALSFDWNFIWFVWFNWLFLNIHALLFSCIS